MQRHEFQYPRITPAPIRDDDRAQGVRVDRHRQQVARVRESLLRVPVQGKPAPYVSHTGRR